VSRGGTSPDRIALPDATIALLIGSEAFGLPEALRTAVAHRVSIPMSQEVDSFSANAAAAILLYALGRPR
jgi:tRNA G18 (ribose-2'-O)-methylase SpoU